MTSPHVDDFNQKPYGERVKETVALLTKLKDLNISEFEPGYVATKEQLTNWVKSGEKWSGEIEFPQFGRKAELTLPYRKDRAATMRWLGVWRLVPAKK
jgi:hypothetical protein